MTAYEKCFSVTSEHTDAYDQVTLSALLYFAQEVSGAHATMLSGSWEQLQEKGLFWAVTRHKIAIDRLPSLGETITLKTWPMVTSRVAYPRAVEGYDADGNRLFRLVSLWVLMDTQRRTLVLPGKGGVQIDGYTTGQELPLPTSLPPVTGAYECLRRVRAEELDRNGHMNNTKYLAWVSEALPQEFARSHRLREFTVCYLMEAHEDETLSLCWSLGHDGLFHMDIYRREECGKKRIFAASLQYENSVL